MDVCKPELWVVGHDLHFPLVHWPTFYAMLDFIKRNEIAGYIFGGDQFDNLEISHHTKGKPIFRERAAYAKNTTTFNEKILKPLEKELKAAERVWITGNHERFEQDLIEEQPELEGVIEHDKLLHLVDRHWRIISLGHAYNLSKLNVIHGEILSGIGNQAGIYPSRKAVDLYSGNVLAGHTHSPQSFGKVSPVSESNKWMAWIAPCMCQTNPAYLKNRPTAWMNGFTIVEVLGQQFNLYPVIVTKGKFVYGGKVYGK